MIFTVIWRPAAEDELMLHWMAATDKEEINEASHAVDQILRNNGDRKGTEFGDVGRILVYKPLAVFFTASLDDRLVTVHQVKLVKELEPPL